MLGVPVLCAQILTLYQEHILLKDFEENETRLFAQLAKQRADKANIRAEMADTEKQMAIKRTEADAKTEAADAVYSEFLALVGGDKGPFFKELREIFKRDVKNFKVGVCPRVFGVRASM